MNNQIIDGKIQFTDEQKKYINPVAQEWIQVLWDEKYPQTEGQLQTSGGYCCLGVGCLVAAEYIDNPEEKLYVSGFMSCGNLEELPNIQKCLGLYDSEGFASYDNIHLGALVSLNDDEEYTFKQIAEHLLQYPEQYFVPVEEQ